MPNPDTIALAALAEIEGLDAVLVGGNAVNLHAYSRTTFDVDLLVRELDMERWIAFFASRGYAISRRTPNFIRLCFAADPGGALPVDLMLANDETFLKIRSESLRRDLGNDLTLAIPSALHLIAMKLHALHNPQRVERGTDLQDVRHLIKTGRVDISSPAMGFWIVMPPTRYDDSSSSNSENDRVRESAALFNLPVFDSLPASDGLSNLEAFQLSLRHALALLPVRLAQGWAQQSSEEEMERFSLD